MSFSGGDPDAPMGATSTNDYKIEFDPNSQKMVVQFPDAYAQYEYQHDSKKFMKVISPRAADGTSPLSPDQNNQSSMSGGGNNSVSMFRHIVP